MGRKKRFETPSDVDRAVEEYFADQDAPTITGLVLALGFMSRQSLVDYDGYGKEYSYITTRARLRVQASYENGLRNREQSRGCQFALSAGFNWAQKTELLTKEERTIELGKDERKILNKLGAELIAARHGREDARRKSKCPT